MNERAEIPEFEVLIDASGRVSFAHPGQARAWLRSKFAGQCIVAQFYEHGKKKTDRQSRGFHAMLQPWAAQGHRIEDLKHDLLEAIFGTIEVTSPVTGEVKHVLAEPHTSTLTRRQYIQLIDQTLEIAAGCGVLLMAPDEYRRAKEAEARKAARAASKGQAA